MNNTLYYGEMVARISGFIHHDPVTLSRLENKLRMSGEMPDKNNVWTICANAAQVFDKIEDLSGEHYIDWHKALDIYSDKLRDVLLNGTAPSLADLIALASSSIQESRATKADPNSNPPDEDYPFNALGSSPSRRQG
ncbi:hypothetical protein [Roseivirga pacifica]|uniref:hypothetical protein n=1 Tax=Roseivirga pacifica TaxID=1267423 RepID=UPI003BAFCEAA